MRGSDFLTTFDRFLLYTVLLLPAGFSSAADAACQYGASDGNNLYSYSLASPQRRFPHGVLSEDGFYKVASNDTIIWFQVGFIRSHLCDGMIFSHDSPKCFDCADCGGASQCGMGCSALVSNNVGGYHVCTTIGDTSSFDINLVDQKNPHMGVTIKMTRKSSEVNCSLSVSVLCNQDDVGGPESLRKSGSCNYETALWHPIGCATVVPLHGKGWGWFSIFFTILLCFLGFYLLVGMVYRFYFLRIRGVDVIPNLEFWTNIPHRAQGWFRYVNHKFRGPTSRERSSYSQANF
ncbi:hypothetical protein V2J09_024183 [Rumex salicifolius]